MTVFKGENNVVAYKETGQASGPDEYSHFYILLDGQAITSGYPVRFDEPAR